MHPFFSWQHALLKSTLEPTTKLVCHTIGCHMALDGSGCFPSYNLIAEESGLSRRTIIEHVQKAVAAGFLTLEHRERENGSQSTNLYVPTMPGGVQELHQGGAGAAPGVVQELHPHNTPSLIPQLTTTSSDNQMKASDRAHSCRSIAILLEDIAAIPDNLRLAAECKHNVPRLAIDDEWARFRNHHISARSKHTRIDLCWDTWCRNAAKYQRERAPNASGTAGRGGAKRYDPVAAATDRALADLFGVRREGHGGQAKEPATSADAWGDGWISAQTGIVDVSPSDTTSLEVARTIDGSRKDSDD